jgi:radical SAM enzyme (TIGR01210 family)
MIERVHPAEGRLIVHPTAAGKIRGAHNCGKCDREVGAAIERYSVSMDIAEFTGLDCECKKRWRCEVELDAAIPAPLGVGLDRRGDHIDALMSP